MYEYLKKFVNPQGRTIQIWHENVFIGINEKVIIEAEGRLGFCFPDQLRGFYLEIGYGNLTTPENPPPDYKFYGYNEIMRPSEIADIVLLGHESGLISQEFLDYLSPDAMPFFHIADSSDFLYMKPISDNPNAIYALGDELVETDFNRFIERLYYESPDFYAYV